MPLPCLQFKVAVVLVASRWCGSGCVACPHDDDSLGPSQCHVAVFAMEDVSCSLSRKSWTTRPALVFVVASGIASPTEVERDGVWRPAGRLPALFQMSCPPCATLCRGPPSRSLALWRVHKLCLSSNESMSWFASSGKLASEKAARQMCWLSTLFCR